MNKHLLVCVSAHGFGHIAQVAPVINTLRDLMPQLRVTVQTMASVAQLRARMHGDFEYRQEGGDIGMVMASALDVQVRETAAAYARIHHDWEQTVAREADALRAIAPDFVLSDVGYLPLAGAQLAGIPNVAMSSLNWADIVAHYCGAISGAQNIIEQMRRAYANADAFLQITPHMPMHDLPNCIAFNPVASVGRNRRAEINKIFALRGDEKLVLVSLGGFDNRLPTEIWPRISGVRWLLPMNWRSLHPDALTLEAANMDFSDLLTSSDALLCKPGYGSFVEAACAALPVLTVARDDWPEAPYLEHWLATHGAMRKITRERMERGEFSDELRDLLTAPRRPAVLPTGNHDVAEWLANRLGD
ncbi:MAG: hypothetical protein LBE24_05710 [Methylobacillus sp.]|jgi:UDP:flavonoid glycosyltransferase YjiC (YdhE family)|nr:hypothetical protein [Methylobacillus sp.]